MSETIQVPKGWELKKISDIGHIITGSTPKTSNSEFYGNDFPFYGPADLGSKIEIFESQKGLTQSGLDVSRVIPEDSILVQCIGDIGKSSIIKKMGACNQQINVIIPNLDTVIPKFVYYWINSSFFRNQMIQNATQTTMSILNKGKFSNLPFFLPQLSIQKQIVTKLDHVLGELEVKKKEILSLIEQNKERIDFFEKNWLSYMVDNEIILEISKNKKINLENEIQQKKWICKKSNNVKIRRGVPESPSESEYVKSWNLPKNWYKKSVGELLHCGAIIDLKDGNHGGIHPKKSEFSKTGMPFITSSQVKNFSIDCDGADKLEGVPLKRLKIGFAKKDDVILTHKGSVGRVAIAKQDCLLSPQTTYYRLNSNLINNEYLMWFFVSRFFVNQRLPIQKQTTRDYISIMKQYTLFVILPPIPIQNKLVKNMKNAEEKFQTQKKQFENIKNNYESKINYINHIQSSVLDSAFSGKLLN